MLRALRIQKDPQIAQAVVRWSGDQRVALFFGREYSASHAGRVGAISECRDLHYLTFSCYGRKPYLSTAAAREVFEASLEKIRLEYQFAVVGYVVMPEHVHLMVSEPVEKKMATALQAVKISVARRLPESPFWQRRYYDFNVFKQKDSGEGWLHAPKPSGSGFG